MLLLGGETKTGQLCHPSHTDGSTMASRNPETKQHHKVLMLKQSRSPQQGQSGMIDRMNKFEAQRENETSPGNV